MKTFIPIECDILNDNRMSALINNHGATGYGVYMVLIIELRNHPDYCLDGETLKFIARKYNIKRKVFDDIVYNYSLFNIENMPDGNLLITSDYVTRIMQNYDDRVSSARIRGKKGADKRWLKEDSNSHSNPIATEKNISEKNILEEEKKEEECAPAAAHSLDKPRWRVYLEDAVKDQLWMECQGMHSGLGARFLKHQQAIVDLFIAHVITHGKGEELFSVADVKYYFANFARRGTATNKHIVESLDALERKQEEEDVYRFETVDPVTGQRMAQGFAIPNEAPPRPNREAIWSYEMRRWM